MNRKLRQWSRREFLKKTASAGALLSVTPFAAAKTARAQSSSRNRITVAHGVGVYSLNPYAVNTSPLQAVWGSIMEPLIDADYEKRGARSSNSSSVKAFAFMTAHRSRAETCSLRSNAY